jgi:hypothetical protein
VGVSEASSDGFGKQEIIVAQVLAQFMLPLAAEACQLSFRGRGKMIIVGQRAQRLSPLTPRFISYHLMLSLHVGAFVWLLLGLLGFASSSAFLARNYRKLSFFFVSAGQLQPSIEGRRVREGRPWRWEGDGDGNMSHMLHMPRRTRESKSN